MFLRAPRALEFSQRPRPISAIRDQICRTARQRNRQRRGRVWLPAALQVFVLDHAVRFLDFRSCAPCSAISFPIRDRRAIYGNLVLARRGWPSPSPSSSASRFTALRGEATRYFPTRRSDRNGRSGAAHSDPGQRKGIRSCDVGSTSRVVNPAIQAS